MGLPNGSDAACFDRMTFKGTTGELSHHLKPLTGAVWLASRACMTKGLPCLSLHGQDRLACGLPYGGDAARFDCMTPKEDNTGRSVSLSKASCQRWPDCINWLAFTL